MEAGTHTFAHLGPAPYRYMGYSRETYQAIKGDPSCPLQPGDCCDHCGMGIMDVFHFRAADGTRFVVGSDCVHKSGDAGLRKVIAADIAKKRREQVAARASDVIGRALEVLPTVRPALASEPHPNAYRANKGATLADWVDWMLANAGRTGKTEAAKVILAHA